MVKERSFSTFYHPETRAQDGNETNSLRLNIRARKLQPKWRLILPLNQQTHPTTQTPLRTRFTRTFGPGVEARAEPSASHPRISDISCTSAFTSRDDVDADLSWPSFASRHGCVETRTLAGRSWD